MHKLRTMTMTAIAAAAVAAGASTAQGRAPIASASQAREYEGTITRVDAGSRTFRIHDTERGTITVRVTNRTRFERLAGFSALRVGLRNIETTVRRVDGRWVANEVERSGGGGQHGGDDDRRGGDDDGGRGRGRGGDGD